MLLMVLVPPPSVRASPERAKRAALRDVRPAGQPLRAGVRLEVVRGGAPADEPLLGSADIQSLADLGNSFEIVKQMKWDPVSTRARSCNWRRRR